MRRGDQWCESSLNAASQKAASAASNLCGRGVGALAAGGRSDAVSQQDLLAVLQNGLVAELQVELEKRRTSGKASSLEIPPAMLTRASHLLLQHVLPLLPHLLHQQREVWYLVAGLQLLQGSVQQAEGASSSHARAETQKKTDH